MCLAFKSNDVLGRAIRVLLRKKLEPNIYKIAQTRFYFLVLLKQTGATQAYHRRSLGIDPPSAGDHGSLGRSSQLLSNFLDF